MSPQQDIYGHTPGTFFSASLIHLLFNMACQMIKKQKSTVTALITLGFFSSLLCLSLATPDIYYDIVYAGIVIFGAMTVYHWRKERKADTKSSPVGMWILLTVFLLFIVLCLILPAL